MIRLLLALLCLAALAPSTPRTTSPPDEPSARFQDFDSLDALIARRLVQHTARFLRPGPEQDPQAGYRTAVGILSWAARLAPDDVEIHRRLAAASAVLDPNLPAVIAGERHLLRLEPGNVMAQMRVINRAIDDRQSVTERLDLCERLLRSTAGGRLAPEVLSHLAYRAAALCTEQGRTSLASSYLEESLNHNPTNLDAAALNALEIDRQTAKVELLVRAMVALVKADPTNQPALSDLIAVVQESGFHQGAADLIEVMSVLVSRQGESISDDLFADYAYLRCADAEPRAGLDLIKQRQDSFDQFERRRRQVQWYGDQQAAQKQAATEGRPYTPPSELPAFSDVTVELSNHLQLTRALLAMAAQADAEVENALLSLEAQWAGMLDDLHTTDQTSLPPAAVSAIAADERRIIADRAWTRLWLNHHVDEAANDLAQLGKHGATDPAELQRLYGWLSLRRGDAPSAIAGLQSLQAVDPLSGLGIALAHVELGHTADAARILGEIYQSQPGQLLGVLSKWKYEILTGRAMPAPRQARSVAKELDRFPQMLGDLILRPQRYFSLSIAPRTDRAKPHDPLTFDVTIGNDGNWPAAIGPGKILSSRLALFPIISQSGRRIRTGMPPLTIDVQSHLVLRPSESIGVPVSIDHTLFGLLIPSLALGPVTIEFQAMLDYRVGPDGAFEPQTWSLVRQSGPMQITPWPGLLGSAPVDLAAELSVDDLSRTIDAISQIGAVLHGRLTRTLDSASNVDLLATADAGMTRLIELWPQLDRRAAAWALLTLPFQPESAKNRIELLDQLEDTARRSTDPLVQFAWLAARSAADSDVVIQGALSSNSPELRAIAEDARAFFAQPAPTAAAPVPSTEEPVK